MIKFGKETFSSEMTAGDLAAVAGVDNAAVQAFRNGVPSWRLERPGVIDAIARATGNDPGEMKAAISLAKARGYGLRAHGLSGPSSFPGQTYPSFR